MAAWLHGLADAWPCGFNTQPPEGGCHEQHTNRHNRICVSTHSHPKVAARFGSPVVGLPTLFQHTATRRWLPPFVVFQLSLSVVSTHSHPKVAALASQRLASEQARFNTQPPEGGCPLSKRTIVCILSVSTHSHPKVAALWMVIMMLFNIVSTHSHPKVAANYKRDKIERERVSTHSHPKVAASLTS